MTAHSWNKLAQVAVASLILVTLLAYVLALLMAIQTIRGPFLGAFVEPTLVVNAVGEDDWNGRAAGLDLPDHLVALDGQPLPRPHALYARISDYEVGDTVRLLVERQNGERRRVSVELQPFPSSALVGFLIFPYGIGLAYLLIGLAVFVARRDKAAGRALSVFCASFALVFGTVFDLYTAHRLTQVWVIGFALIGGGLIHLASAFPQRSSLIRRWPWLPWCAYVPSVAIALWALDRTTDLDHPWAYIGVWRALYLYTAVGALFWMTVLLWRRLRADSPMVREQIRIIFLGLLGAGLPIVSWLILATLGVSLGFQPAILFPSLILLPLSIAYALLRYRLLDVDLILSRSVSYGLLTLLIVGGYLLLVDLLGLLLGTSIGTDNPVWIAFFILLLTLAFEPLRTRLQRAADTLFFRDRIDYREELESYSHALGRLLSQSSVFAALASRVETALHPEQVAFYLYDTYEHQFAPLANTVQGRSKLICFSPDGGLASALLARGESLYLMADQPLPVDLEPEARQLTALGASLYVPMAQHGWMVLGEKRSGLPYTSSDLGYLEALGDQTGLALDKIQLISDLERRVSELNALYRTSQAVNSSLELQTVLNLITEKAVEISGAEGGSLFLIDPDSAELVLTFTVGPLGSEPLGLRVLPGQGIAGAVAHTRQPIIIDDVRQDPRWFPDLDQRTGYVTRTLLAVPLGSEDHSIGVLEVVNKKAGSSFDEQDQRLLLAFASHVTVAIENARLYQDVRRMKEFNEGLVQSMAEGMIVADATGHITLVNPAAAILLGYTTEELVGQRWMAFIPPDQHPIADAADERRARGEVDSYELELLHKDGRRVAVLVSGSPRFEQGRYQGSLAIFTDITQVLAHQKVERDLALAWEIQNGFLPDALPDVPGWQLAATLKPASETSGDFFDVISLPNGRVGLLVADVSDKGTAAALYMAVSCTLIRTFAVEYDKEPERALRAVHRRILADTKSDQFVTVFYGVLDPTTGTLTYCNAGHNSPYLFRAASYGGSAQQGALAEELDSTGPALGIRALNEMIWERRTVQLAPGDTLVLYSDGITEAQNLQRAFFDETRLLDVAQANVGRSAQTIQQAILAQVQEFVGDAPQMDDIALMVTVRCSPEGQTGL